MWDLGSKRLALADMKENLPPYSRAVKGESGGVGFRGKGMPKGGSLPYWQEGEVLEMQALLEGKTEYLKVFKLSMEESLHKKSGVEGELRRARLEFTDKQVMHQHIVQNVEKQRSTTQLLVQQIEKEDASHATLFLFQVRGHSHPQLAGKVDSLEETLKRRWKEHERIQFTLSMEEKTEKYYL